MTCTYWMHGFWKKKLLTNFNANIMYLLHHLLTAYLICKLFFPFCCLFHDSIYRTKIPRAMFHRRKPKRIILRIPHVLFIGLAKFDMATIQTCFAAPVQKLALTKILDFSQTKHYYFIIGPVSSLAKSGHNHNREIWLKHAMPMPLPSVPAV